MKKSIFLGLVTACLNITSFACEKEEIPFIWIAAYHDDWNLTHKIYLSEYSQDLPFDRIMSCKFALAYYFFKNGDHRSMFSVFDSAQQYLESKTKKE